MMKLKFRTNVKCQGCRTAITPFLDKEPSISSWKVDIFDPDRILTVEGENVDPAIIIGLLHQAGYQGELMS
ncbi:MAG: heavy-metal-associated domain-containing protein [Bacteroidales bacterium]